jgi:3-oxoacyl-[acyl-carrier protein] reductase
MRPLDGHVAIVTGAARGIGEAISQRLAQDGAAVCAVDVDIDLASRVASELVGAGESAIALELDVTRLEDFVAVADHVANHLGDVTILVNNAGLTRPAAVHRMTDADWDVVHDVCLRGAFNGFRAVAPWFRDREHCRPRRVVNIASVAVHGGMGTANYSSAKAGVVGLTMAMADEWACFGVTVNAVAPGLIDTRLSAPLSQGGPFGIPDAMREQATARIPVGRIGRPEDVAAAVAFFCRPDAGFITGQLLEVHGGLADLRPLGHSESVIRHEEEGKG